MKTIPVWLLTVCLGALRIGASAQPDSTFLRHASALLDKQPAMEKVYLHLNKKAYDFGDTIWYKAYTVIGTRHQLSALSGILYVELLSPADSVVDRQVLPLVSGVGWSDLPIQHKLRPGTYRLRAYTNWMRNNGPGSFYDERILIGGEPAKTVQASGEKPDIQFFPEGGYLVNGLRSRVAFKAVNSQGLGISVNGTITDSDGKVVADFSSQHLGMGEFAFTPQPGKTYTAKIRIGETGFTEALPTALPAGYSLALNNSRSDSLFIKVAVNEQQYSNTKDSLFYIIGQSNGKVYYTGEGRLTGQVYTASVGKSRFPTGIAQFTLFSSKGEPVAERIVYVQGHDTLQMKITGAAAMQTTRRQVKIAIKINDNTGSPVSGSFSATVVNETAESGNAQAAGNIESSLLLRQEVKGYIEQPGYYFKDTTEHTRADLDLLLLTQGYRRYEWKTLLADSTPQLQFQPERALTISGSVKPRSGKQLDGIKISLLATKQNLVRDTLTDAQGRFSFADLPLTDTTNILLKARKANDDDRVTISLDQPGFPAITKENWPVAVINPDTATSGQKYKAYKDAQIADYRKYGIPLKEVTIKGARPPKPPELIHSDNLNGPGHADQIIMGDKLEGCVTLSDCLQGRITGVVFTKADFFGQRKAYLMRGMGRLDGIRPMVIIVDGIIVEGNNLDEVNSKDIYSIEVLRSGAYLAIYGSNAPFGALVITTKRGYEDPQRVTPKPLFGLLPLAFNGYHTNRTFYSPKYQGPKTDKQAPDNRTAIYWNPNLLTDEHGETSFEYFNADTKGTYRIEVEGIDDNGNLGRQVLRYKVE